jgi:hypothetical protein
MIFIFKVNYHIAVHESKGSWRQHYFRVRIVYIGENANHSGCTLPTCAELQHGQLVAYNRKMLGA